MRSSISCVSIVSAGKPNPPIVDICACGWEMKDGVPMPAVYPATIVPPKLLDMVSCQCGTHTLKTCITGRYSCRRAGLPCISDCECDGGERRENSHTHRQHEKMRMKRTDPICINNMMRLKRTMMASLVHMWRTTTMKLSCKNGTFLNDTTRMKACIVLRLSMCQDKPKPENM